MSTIYPKYEFNTFFMTVDEKTGKYPTEKHDELARQFRAHLCNGVSGDGIGNVDVNSKGFDLHMETSMTTLAQVDAAVAQTMVWAAESLEGVFPLRGNKTPQATRINYNASERSSTEVKVVAELPSDLFVFTPPGKALKKIQNKLAANLVRFDGVRAYGVWIREVILRVDTAVASTDDAKVHITKVLNAALKGDKDFFPFYDEETVEPTFRLIQC